eukprot:TRINITY_DN585_c0_g3_i2.p1 TRINITY_DN585_c0_g3~~TRINITY_DN585_c0_g3_i2.p1  ORF type:complete len:327 (+),score=122.09 TRINITY_DN585_c0_g3_i2:303-1283(+)
MFSRYDETACAFAFALSQNKSLLHLEMNRTKIGDTGALDIASALEINNSLLTIKMQGNYITEDAGRLITDSLKQNKRLRTVELSGNQIDHSHMLVTKRICQRNRGMAKHAKAAPLLREIMRLTHELSAFEETDAQLSREVTRCATNQEEILNIHEAIEILKMDQSKQTEQLKQQLEKQEKYTEDAIAANADRVNDLKTLEEDSEKKFEEIQVSIQEQVQMREYYQERADTLETQLEKMKEALPKTVIELEKKIEAIKEQRLEYDELGKQRRARLAEEALKKEQAKEKKRNRRRGAKGRRSGGNASSSGGRRRRRRQDAEQVEEELG